MSTYTDILVVVHGIGDQFRNATVRSVANRLATSHRLNGDAGHYVTAPQPLGYFHNDPNGPVISHLVDQVGRLGQTPLNAIGVAEVYWADIPQALVDEAHTLDETKEWAGTVVARARALCAEAKAARGEADPKTSTEVVKLVEPNFDQAADTLDEMIDTIAVLENIFALAEKAGVFTFDLKDVLDKYLGDVQVVAEFGYYRTNVVGRFHKAMEEVYAAAKQDNANVRLHVVAHSEGTVVSFHGLLQAMSKRRVIPEDRDRDVEARTEDLAAHPEWLEHVAGYMTFGSPIDKHLLLWPHMWDRLDPKQANALFAGKPIKWHNYYDYGDPVGFKLDTARDWIALQGVKAFDFPAAHDHGFARYMLPGAAHNQYWDDPDVFEHFVTNVVAPNATEPKPAPATRTAVYFLSPFIPYLLSFVILVLGTYLLYKQVADFAHPEPEPLEAAELSRMVGITPITSLQGWSFFRSVLGVTTLVAGTTLLSRLPRMMIPGFKRRLLLSVGFIAACGAYCWIVPTESRAEIGAAFAGAGTYGPTLGILALAWLAGMFGLTSLAGKGSKRTRWFWRGMRPMLAVGIFAIAAVLLGRIYGSGAPLTDQENKFIAEHFPDRPNKIREQIEAARLERVELDQLFFGFKSKAEYHLKQLPNALPLLANRPSLWPVILASVAFLYLWWLSTLIFDLAFVWQRYVRNSVSNDRLRSWYHIKHGIAESETEKPAKKA